MGLGAAVVALNLAALAADRLPFPLTFVVGLGSVVALVVVGCGGRR